MALVRNFEEVSLQRESVHGEVDCTYSVFMSDDGKKFIQFDTYGSPARKIKGKKSQSIQLDESTAKRLVALINSVF